MLRDVLINEVPLIFRKDLYAIASILGGIAYFAALQFVALHAFDEIIAAMNMVAEGVNTTAAALALGSRHGAELPITSEVAAVLAGSKTPREALGCLMLRPQRGEWEGA